MLKRYLKHSAVIVAASLHHPVVVGDIGGALLRGQFETARQMARTAARRPNLEGEKIISHRYRYLWICNPKVASRSIIAALRAADPGAEIISDKTVSDIYALYPEARDYFSFAFIRHPFDRALSLYSEIHFSPARYEEAAQRLHKKEKRQGFFDRCYGLESASSFDDYCRWLNTIYGSDAFADIHFRSQHLMIRLEDGRRPDFLGRLENIGSDLRQVAGRVGMSPPELPMLNTMAGWQPPSSDALKTVRSEMRAQLTERNRTLLSRRYAEDMELAAIRRTEAA